jgi:uncharacterized protein YcbK (DUF882 family)
MSYPKLTVDLEAPISKFFKWKEALYLPRVNGYAVPTRVQIDHIVSQARALDKIREYFERPILVHSWLRPVWYNAQIGGALQSQHTLGSATDFSVSGFTHDEVKKVLQNKPDLYMGRGEIDTTNWVHLDLRDRKWFYARGRLG